jgi:hypothetical protein
VLSLEVDVPRRKTLHVPTPTRTQLAAGLIALLLLHGVAQAWPRTAATNDLQAHPSPSSAHEVSNEATDTNLDETCPDTGNTITARVGSRVKVLQTTRLRSRLGHDSVGDVMIARSTFVRVEASDDRGRGLLVEDTSHHLGWVRPCEIAGVVRHVADQVEVTRGGSLREHPHDGSVVMKLEKGALLTVADWRNDSVLLTASDGMSGWYPAARLTTASERTSAWHPGSGVEWPCAGSQHKRSESIKCGELDLRVLAVATTKQATKLLLGTEDGRWGWVGDRVTPVASEPAVEDDKIELDVAAPATPSVAEAQTAKPAPPTSGSMAAMPGMAMATIGSPSVARVPNPTPHEHDMVMDGMGDMSSPTDGASLSVAFLTAMPVGDAMASTDTGPMRTPHYEATVSASAGGHLAGDYDYGIAATFSAAGSLTADGQARGEEAQGGQGSVSISRHLNPHTKVSLGGGYALAFVSPGAMADSEWDFLAIHAGPYAKLVVSGDPSPRWSYSLLGTAQLTSDADGMSASILVADAMAMASLNSWVTLRLDAMAMKMAMGDTMWSAGPGLSFAVIKHLSASVSATGMDMGGMTMWTTTAGVGAHF